MKTYHIRLANEQDTGSFFELIDSNRSRLEDFFAGTVSKNSTIEATAAYMKEVQEKIRQQTYLPFLVIDNASGRIAGFIDIKNIDWNIPKAELGSFIDRDFEGRGIITSALNEVIGRCFNEYGIVKLFLRTHASNDASRKVAVKCGFQLEGTIRKDYKTTKGEIVDLLYYGLVNERQSQS